MRRTRRNNVQLGTSLPYANAGKSTIINAAALQDRLARSIALDVYPRVRRPRILQEAAIENSENLFTRSASNSEYRCVWVCEICTFENDERVLNSSAPASDRCFACGAQRSQRQHPQTQKHDLVTRPSLNFTQDYWEHCENQAEARGDTKHPCPICREPFGIKAQIILSCSHMFHLACITSFERFLRTSQHVCPLCRKQNYQKRLTTVASAYHRETSAKRIQAVFRGFVARRRAAFLLQKFYSSGKGNPIYRRRFFANRVGKTADRIISAMSKRDDSIDALLAEFDKSLCISRHVFKEQVPEVDIGAFLPERDDWIAIFGKAKARDGQDCAICLTAFSSSMEGVSLLNCSHAFHSQCLSAFEEFNINEVLLCPVCRIHYRSQTWLQIASIIDSQERLLHKDLATFGVL